MIRSSVIAKVVSSRLLSEYGLERPYWDGHNVTGKQKTLKSILS